MRRIVWKRWTPKIKGEIWSATKMVTMSLERRQEAASSEWDVEKKDGFLRRK